MVTDTEGGTQAEKTKAWRWEDSIKRYHQEVRCGDNDWSHLAQDGVRWRALVNVLMNLLVPLNVGNFLSSRGPGSFSSRTLLHGVLVS